MHWPIKAVTKGKISKVGRKIIHSVIEVEIKGEMKERASLTGKSVMSDFAW